VLHVNAIVSRKTPLDGKLEIPEMLAERLSAGGVGLSVVMDSESMPVRLERMPCTCSKGATGSHVHHFLAADELKSLPAGSNVNLSVDVDEGVIHLDIER
jgi:hypothetical protein